MKKENRTHQFCHALLAYGAQRSRAMTNFVMSLSSSPSVDHAVSLSASPFCHYHYSNLTKVLEYWEVKPCDFRSLIGPFVPPPRQTAEGVLYYGLIHDFTKLLKAHSPCLEDRQYVPVCNNVIFSNRAIGVGYPVSALHLGTGDQGWCPPLGLERVASTADMNAVAVGQITSLLEDKNLPFGQQLCLLCADTSYGKAIFLAPLYDMKDLVLIVRLRAGMKVYQKAPAAAPTGGAKRIYGDQFYLSETSQWKKYRKKETISEVWQAALCEQAADEQHTMSGVLKNGRKVLIHIRRWNDLMIRSKPEASMKDKPFDVLRIQMLDAETQQPVFERPLFLAVSGKRKDNVTSTVAQQQYRERYDVEPLYCFAKNRLLMDKLQTPNVKHLDKWLCIVQTAIWLLFTASREIKQTDCPVWQKYLPKNKTARNEPEQPLTIAQTQRALHLLFCTFDKTPFLPLKCKKGKGRSKGQTFPQRTRFNVVKKIKKSIRKTKMQQNE